MYLRKVHKKQVDIKNGVLYTVATLKKKEGERMTDTSKIRSMIREKGDIDEMIFASQGKDAGQTQTHSDR